ncbi:class I SAM-dependent methyltransferase [Halobacillus rhizosphaerae]|uniref:class I SAM-dependent methyltransferase n=1 Tax=Halobacillus rhizosphaerae TaxID=3064889 RepID=UPI00398B385C
MSEDIKKKVQDIFSKNKEAYVSSKTHSNRADLDQITKSLKPQTNWVVLDIATGGGHVAKQLSPSVSTVFASDITKDMLENTAHHLSHLKNVYYVIADAENLPFLNEIFDAVTCRIAPHHFPEPEKFVEEVSRVLKPQGKFLLIDNTAPEDDELDFFYNTFEKKRDPSHCRALKVSEWKEILMENQMTSIKESIRQKPMTFPDWVARTMDDKTIQQEVEQYFLQATEDAKRYFSIKQTNGYMESFAIDEWMILLEKV